MDINQLLSLTEELKEAAGQEKEAQEAEARAEAEKRRLHKVVTEKRTRVVELLKALRTGEYQPSIEFPEEGHPALGLNGAVHGDASAWADLAPPPDEHTEEGKRAWYEEKGDELDPSALVPGISSPVVRDHKIRLWLNEALRAVSPKQGHSPPAWNDFVVPGLSDEELAAELAKVPTHTHTLEDDSEPIYEWRLKPPRFYVRDDDQERLPPFPTLEGAPLLTMARRVLTIGQRLRPTEDEPGPLDSMQALARALRLEEVADALGKFSKPGSATIGIATDDEILAALSEWPVSRYSYAPPALPWATVGGDQPAFFCGISAREGNWPAGTPTLSGAELVKEVRKLLKLRAPRVTRSEAKESFAKIGPNEEGYGDTAAVRKRVQEIVARVKRSAAEGEREAKDKRNQRDRERREAKKKGTAARASSDAEPPPPKGRIQAAGERRVNHH